VKQERSEPEKMGERCEEGEGEVEAVRRGSMHVGRGGRGERVMNREPVLLPAAKTNVRLVVLVLCVTQRPLIV